MLAWAVSLIPVLIGGQVPDGPVYADVQPILQRSCYPCHGPDKQTAGYRLDVRSIALKGGDSGARAIVPHASAESRLVRYISGAEPDIVMPPPDSGVPPLSQDEIALIAAWIDAGPNWPDDLANEPEDKPAHWSLRPLVQPELPGDAANPIDAFIRAALDHKGLAPSPEADRRTLIRRVYFDLTGLPPAPEEVEAFVNDPDPKAYDALVDRLLASPRYGERWARHWFDTIQFADSHGFEHDLARDHAWPFRDYVIEALNADTPWDRFIREQLAADYFYPDRPELTPALGYLGAVPFDLSTYSTAEVTFDYLDRDLAVTQTMSAFVGTTANCARCHSHKFDPIPQEDYYALQAVFAGVIKGNVAYDPDPAVKRERDRWIAVLAAAKANDGAALNAEANRAVIAEWLEQRGPGAKWTPLVPETFQSAEGTRLILDGNGVLVASGSPAEKDTYTITAASELTSITAIRLEGYAHDSLPMNGPGRAENGNLHLSEFTAALFRPGQSEPVKLAFRRATADYQQPDWDIAKAIDGKLSTAWGIHPNEGRNHHAVFELAEPMKLAAGDRLSIALHQDHGSNHLIGAFRLFVGDAPAAQTVALPADVETALALPEADRSEDQRAAVAAAVIRYAAEEALAQLPPQAVVYAAAPKVEVPDGNAAPKFAALEKPKPVHRMIRGDFDRPAEEVGPGALAALAALPARFDLADPADEAARRAALADWIASPDNVLTWRSAVNRVWHYHFGRGLCDTPSDLGEMGGAPSHPELIDWLALWFRDEARGSLMALHRLIVTSETYRQSSAARDEAEAIDGENRLLWRQNVQRLDAGQFRDVVLAVSGRLDLTMGGAAVRHFYESPGPQITPVLDYATFDWNGEGAGRRAIYAFVWRGIPDPVMEALDFPDLGLLAPQRGFSASALQSLTLYNNPFTLHHAHAMAQRLQSEAPTLNAQIARAANLLWYRDPSAEEAQKFEEYASSHGLAALCRVLLNSNEFLFVY